LRNMSNGHPLVVCPDVGVMWCALLLNEDE
jgi:hypothetical protein